MKILLIQPAKEPITLGGEDFFCYEPLALEYIAAGVRQNHDVRILDLRFPGEDLDHTLASYQPDVVGLTAYTVHVNAVRRLAKHVKCKNPRTLVVVGGHHATVAPGDFFSPAIDVVAIGEGVFTFRGVVERFEQRDNLGMVPGIAFRRDGKLIQTDAAPAMALDSFPFPERTLTAKYRNRYFSEWMKPLASIRTSKGCPYRCNFCALWKLTNGRYLRRKPEQILEELAGIEEESIFFADDESLLDVVRMKTLARLIRESGMKKRIFLYGRSDTIARNRELLTEWREAGLERVFIGLEFCRNKDLSYIKKGSTVKDNDEAVGILNDLGVDIYASFIVRPEFGDEDFTALGSYCRQLGLRYGSFAVLTPLPGTDLYEEVKDRLITTNYDLFDFLHTLLPTTLPLKAFYERLAWLYNGAIPLGKRLSLLREYRLRELPRIIAKSNRLMRRLRAAYQDYE